MRIISKTNNTKRKKKWMMAAIAGMLMLGVQQPVQAAVTQNDLAPPVSDASTHIQIDYGKDKTYDTHHKSTYKYVYFGMYPQREIKGTELTDAIRKGTYDSNGDAIVNGKRYRRIQFSQTAVYPEKQSITEEDFDKSKVEWSCESTDGYRYFLYEPIRWRILSNKGNTLLLQTTDGIDRQAFSSLRSPEPTVWLKSDLRKWLNYNGGETDIDKNYYRSSNGFYYYAFSDEQKARIQTTSLVQDLFDGGFSEEGNTEDKIFILSNTEAKNTDYGFCDNRDCYARGNIQYTGYSKALMGYWFPLSEEYWARTYGDGYLHICTYLSDRRGQYISGTYLRNNAVTVLPVTNVSYKLSDCFKVSFVTGTEDTIEDQVMIASSVAKEPQPPVKEGYTFLGWYLDKDCKKPYDFTTNLSTDTVLYAGWKDPNSKEVVSPQEVKEAEKVTDFKTNDTSYKVDSKIDKTVIFEGFIGKNKEKEKLTVPSTIEYGGITYKVTSIDANAFKDCKSLTEVTIGKYITEIPKGTFTSCTKLEKVTFKDGSQLTTIGENAFSGCKNLTEIKLPSSVTSIGSKAFYKCSALKSITIPSGVSVIEKQTFYGCSSLTKVVIGKNVTVIKYGAFQNCKKLKTVTFEKGSQLTTIGSNVFYGCSKLTGIKLPSGVTSIGSKSFYKCSALKSITIPSKVSIIEKQTFYGCSNMAKATIGKKVTTIKQGAFQNCKKLKTITVKTHSLSKSKVGKNAFKSINKKATFKVPKKKYKTYMKIFKQKKIGYKSSMKIKK